MQIEPPELTRLQRFVLAIFLFYRKLCPERLKFSQDSISQHARLVFSTKNESDSDRLVKKLTTELESRGYRWHITTFGGMGYRVHEYHKYPLKVTFLAERGWWVILIGSQMLGEPTSLDYWISAIDGVPIEDVVLRDPDIETLRQAEKELEAAQHEAFMAGDSKTYWKYGGESAKLTMEIKDRDFAHRAQVFMSRLPEIESSFEPDNEAATVEAIRRVLDDESRRFEERYRAKKTDE